MVLDEDALEAMLKRDREAEEGGESPPARLTDQTDEFEVYERPQEEGPPAQEQAAPPQQQAPARPQEEELFEELGAPQEAPAQRVAPQPEEPAVSMPDPEPPQTPTEDARPPVQEPEPAPAQPAPQSPPTQPPTPEQPVPTPEKRSAPTFQPLTPQHEAHTEADEDLATAPRSHAPQGPATDDAPAPTGATDQDQASTAQANAPAASGSAAAGSGDGCRIALVKAEFNAELTDMMADLARKRAAQLGADVVVDTTVPGVFDLPLTAQGLARRDDVDCVVVLGVVVQGETKHDEVITHAAAQQLARIACETGTPIGLGVTGPGMTWKQAEARIVNGKHAVDAAVGQWKALVQR